MSRLTVYAEHVASLKSQATELAAKEVWTDADASVALYLISKLSELPDTYEYVERLDKHMITFSDQRRDAGHLVTTTAKSTQSTARKSFNALFVTEGLVC